MPQPPDLRTVTQVLDRARVLIGEETAEQLGIWLTDDWRHAVDNQDSPADVAAWTAVQQLMRATRARAAGQPGLANMLDHLAEAAVLGWQDELTVSTTEVPAQP